MKSRNLQDHSWQTFIFFVRIHSSFLFIFLRHSEQSLFLSVWQQPHSCPPINDYWNVLSSFVVVIIFRNCQSMAWVEKSLYWKRVMSSCACQLPVAVGHLQVLEVRSPRHKDTGFIYSVNIPTARLCLGFVSHQRCIGWKVESPPKQKKRRKLFHQEYDFLHVEILALELPLGGARHQG